MLFVALGACTHELIGVVDHLPPIGTTQEFRQFSAQGSGISANAAVSLAHWGQQTRFIGKVGDDPRGHEIVAALQAEGVDTSFVVQQPNAISQLRWALAESKHRGFRTFATEGSVAELQVSEIDFDKSLDAANILLVDSRFPQVATEMAARAKNAGLYIIFYAEELNQKHAKLLSLANHVIASERTAGRFVRDPRLEAICDGLLEHGPERATVTIGPEGVVGKELNQPFLQKDAVDVEFVDALGANGTFFAATAYATSQNLPFEQLLAFANAAAALSCRGFGPRAQIPTLTEIHQRL